MQSKSRFGQNPQIPQAIATGILDRVNDQSEINGNISRLTRTNLNQIKSQASRFKAGVPVVETPSDAARLRLHDGETITVSIAEVRQLSSLIKQMTARGKVAKQIAEV